MGLVGLDLFLVGASTGLCTGLKCVAAVGTGGEEASKMLFGAENEVPGVIGAKLPYDGLGGVVV